MVANDLNGRFIPRWKQELWTTLVPNDVFTFKAFQRRINWSITEEKQAQGHIIWEIKSPQIQLGAGYDSVSIKCSFM